MLNVYIFCFVTLQKEHHTANDIVVIPVMWHCASKSNTFYAILLVIQAVFLLYGAFLAFTTRKVTQAYSFYIL